MPKLAHHYTDNLIECGCDEAGRGCLAGPVVAAAVILPAGFSHPLLNDSKQLSEKKRDLLRPIIEAEAMAFGVGVLSPQEIDKVNIHNASYLAMHEAIKTLKVTPEHLIIDGNRFIPFPGIPHSCIVKGDAKFMSIAAASVLAKTYRDELMTALHLEHPQYDWNQNKGYPTKNHRKAIAEYGTTNHHRMSFQLLPKQLNLPL